MTEEYIAIGPNYWGRGSTIEEAKQQLKKAGRGAMSMRGRFPYVVYKVGPDTYITDFGDLSYPADGPKPERVEARMQGKAR